MHAETHTCACMYGVASVSRIDSIIGLVAKESYKSDTILQKRPIIFIYVTRLIHVCERVCDAL